jgi:hypothetical protein
MTQQLDRRKFLEHALKLPFVASASYGGLGFRLTFAADIDDVLTDHQSASLQQFCYRLFPYPEVGEEPYRLAVSAISVIAKEDPSILELIDQGIDSMDSQQAGTWLDLNEDQQVAIMKQIEQGEFFKWIYPITVNQVFTHAAVWEHIGYEGSSMEIGGYLHNGFDDIDWV